MGSVLCTAMATTRKINFITVLQVVFNCYAIYK